MGAIIWQKVTTTNTTGGATIMGSFPYPRNGILKLDYEFILLFKKQGIPPKPTREQKEMSVISKEDWNTYFSGHWYFAGAKQEGHIAMFPEELPARLIKMFSFAGDTVLDPSSAVAQHQWLPVIWGVIQSVMKLTKFYSNDQKKLQIEQADLC
jgi:site-specific DNA-methyltransferase (adenine-specific)